MRNGAIIPAQRGTPESRRNRDQGAILEQFAHPSSIRTKNLTENRYEVALTRDAKHRDGRVTIDFDQVVAPRSESLLDRANLKDLLTAKIYVLQLLSSSAVETRSPTVLIGRFRQLLWLLRWRNEAGIRSMSSLNEGHFEKYVRDIHYGKAGLLPLHERATAYVEELRRHGEGLPTYLSRGKEVVAWSEISSQLGLSKGHNLFPEARNPLLDYLRQFDANLHAFEMSRLKWTKVEGEYVLTSSGIAELLQPWDYLWRFRPYLRHDPIGFRAFTGTRTRSSLAISIGRDVERTEDIPPYQACYLLDCALTWVFEFAPTVISYLKAVAEVDKANWHCAHKRAREIAQAIRTLNQTPGGQALPTTVLPAYQRGKWHSHTNGVDVRELAYVLLPAACFIIISTFTARREGEISSLFPTCIEEIDGELWLLSWIEKTLRDLDRTPVPECVKKAVDVLRQLQDVTQHAGSPKYLFDFIEPTPTHRKVDFIANQAIARFSKIVQLPPLPDGTPCRLATHKFRRFFCIAYYYRYDFPMLLALSFHLRHFDYEMTKHYLSALVTGTYLELIDKRRASRRMKTAAKRADGLRNSRREEFETDRIKILASRFKAAIVGEFWLGGRGGERLMEQLNELLNDIGNLIVVTQDSSVQDNRLNAAILEFSKTRYLEPNPDKHSLCCCGTSPSDCSVAQCLRRKERAEGPESIVGASGPDLAYADRRTCGECVHGVQTSHTLPRLIMDIELEERLQKLGPTEESRELATDNVEMLKDLLIRCANSANAPRIEGLERFVR